MPGSSGRAGLAELAAAFTDLPIVVIHDVIYHEATQGILGKDLTEVITRHVCEKKLQQIVSCLLQGRRWFPAQMIGKMRLRSRKTLNLSLSNKKAQDATFLMLFTTKQAYLALFSGF
ncbi:hypothetical protein Q4488_18035 [Amphritea sp. 1_MG-2023]|uniref:hypothetical protein n=1 Tax=Amphritea sp. 1_MG-2023 TaxID=3062670 RepID=UPI0026E323B5|nr:hypothetical protein [Amphritea sp. 1_MG-2023]MDO6565278.1 hypothetical protein [Amphritea sp. 1_MG-2023]